MNIVSFTSIRDFKSFIKNLSPSEIQSWSTKNWLYLYQAIDDLVLSQRPIIDISEFTNKTCVNEFIKLYKNYRFDPVEFDILHQMAEKAAENLAQQEKIDLVSILEDHDKVHPLMEKIVNVVQKISQKPHEIELNVEWGLLRQKIRGTATYDKITLFKNKLRDSALFVAAHEAAHALLQKDDFESGAKKTFQKRKLAHSEEFSQLLHYNHQYYLQYKNEKATNTEEVFEGYKHQPIEKHASFFGYFLERSYRDKTGQSSERCAMELKKILGSPLHAHYENRDVIMEYSKEHISKIAAVCTILPKYLQYKQQGDIIQVRLKPSFKAMIFLEKMKYSKLSVSTDITVQQYLAHPTLSKYTSTPTGISLPKIADFSKHTPDATIYHLVLDNANCENCVEIIFPQHKSNSTITRFWNSILNTKLPEKIVCHKSSVRFKNCDFSRVKRIVGQKAIISIQDTHFSQCFDFSEVSSIRFSQVDFSDSKSIKWPSKILSLEGCKLPETVDFSTVKSINLCGADLSNTKSIKLPENIDNITVSKEILGKYPVLRNAIAVVRERKKMKDHFTKKTKSKYQKEKYTSHQKTR